MSGFVSISARDRCREFDIKQLENVAFQPRLKQVQVGQHTMTPLLAFISIPLLMISGCAGLASTGTMSSSSPDEAVHCDMATLHRIESGFHVIDPSASQIQLKDLQAGQQVRLVTSASTVAELNVGGSLDTTEYVGTIDAIDDNNILLKDASLVTDAIVVQTPPILGQVPYISRLFTYTSRAKETHPLSHLVTIPRSKVIVALSTDSELVERMGVDFDFNANKSVEGTEVEFLVRKQSNQQLSE